MFEMQILQNIEFAVRLDSGPLATMSNARLAVLAASDHQGGHSVCPFSTTAPCSVQMD